MSFEQRRVTDPHDLRALSHPLRLRLLELLDERPLTATEAALALDTTPANCSFHLRLLARHGFVTEAPGGSGRQRPWQLADPEDVTIVGRELDDDGRQAAHALAAVLDERQRQRVGQWRRTRDDFPAEWQRAANESFLVAHLTAAELADVTAALHRVLRPYLARPRAERPPGSTPIDIHLTALPRRRPEETTTP